MKRDLWTIIPTNLNRGSVCRARIRGRLVVSFIWLTFAPAGCGSGEQEHDSSGKSDEDVSSDGDIEDTENDGDISPDESSASPGTVVLHRLNRAEYNATIRDLFGESLNPANDFPSEDPSFGFDNIAEVLTISPLQFELYERATSDVVAQVTKIPVTEPQRFHFEAESIHQSTGAECCGGFWNIYAAGEVSTSLVLPADGSYRLTVRAFGHQAGDELPKMSLLVNGIEVGQFEVSATESAPELYTAQWDAKAGTHTVAAAFINDFFDPDANLDRNLLVDWIEVEGPFGATDGENKMRDRIVTCDPAELGERPCLAQIVREFAPKAWRRPLTNDELKALDGLYERAVATGGGFEEALKLTLSSLLLSPNFIFRVEVDPNPDSSEAHPLSAYELASRLSYFLWSSMPDDELFAHAKDNSLLEDETLRNQLDRMLDDPRAQALVDNFAGQWLAIRALEDVFKDVGTFPEFDEDLRLALKRERELFFRSILEENRSLHDLLTADESFVNQRLADFYGLDFPDSDPDEFHSVSLAVTKRRGIFGQAGLMTVLGHPETTAPVLRGKWVMEQLLCSAPPPPPSDIDIPPIEPDDEESMREKLARHRADPACASCHELMDPIGLALEKFDGIGDWRETEAGKPIDVTGQLPDGTQIDGAHQLAIAIAQSEDFAACAVEKSLIYALGRGMTKDDKVFIESIATRLTDDDLRIRTLLREVVLSRPFRERQGGE